MERHEALGFFEMSESYIKMYLKEIKGNSDPLVFNGTTGINNIFKVEEYIRKVIEYIRDKKEDSERIKKEVLNLRDLVTELYQEANQKGFIGFKGICECIIDSINALERFDPIPETDKGGCLIIGDKEPPTKEPLNKAQVMMGVRNEPFKPRKNGDAIPYKKCYERLTEGKIKRSNGKDVKLEIIDKQYDLELFKYCVERADITMIYKSRKKSYARLFMNDIAEYFTNPSEFRKAAALAFNVKQLNVGTNGEGIRADYRSLMNGVFPDNANYQKKMSKKSK